ncbi:hypothetical protein PAMP_018854 [Pampus punctatissimus]
MALSRKITGNQCLLCCIALFYHQVDYFPTVSSKGERHCVWIGSQPVRVPTCACVAAWRDRDPERERKRSVMFDCGLRVSQANSKLRECQKKNNNVNLVSTLMYVQYNRLAAWIKSHLSGSTAGPRPGSLHLNSREYTVVIGNERGKSYGGTSKSPNSSKSLCGDWLTQKKWESLKFNISRRTELFLKLEDFFWREHLSKLALPYGIKGSELQLLKVLAATANYQMPANTGKLNDAPVRGYEEDVGNKTTMRFFYPESASYNPGLHNEPSTLMVLVPFKQQDLRWLKEILYNEKRQPVHPTTGILAVFVALNYCDVVHIAGFGYPTSKTQRLPIHYYGYDTMKSMKNSYHDLNHEAQALKRLEDLDSMWLYGVTVCKELIGQFVWEEAEEIQYVAGYLERGHLAWLTDNSPTAQRAAVSQVLMQTQYHHGNRENE